MITTLLRNLWGDLLDYWCSNNHKAHHTYDPDHLPWRPSHYCAKCKRYRPEYPDPPQPVECTEWQYPPNYRIPVIFTGTNRCGCGPEDEDDIYTVEEFIEHCVTGSFVDYDGYGYPVKNRLAARGYYILPSRLDKIPEDATHVVWFNR